MSEILVAIRTHIWNSDVQELAYKLYLQSINLDFVILFDETHNIADTKPFEKVSHTADMTSIKLPHWPENVNNLHYNGDYVIYKLRQEKPNYKFYFILENDAVININIEKIFKNAIQNKIDFIGHIDQIDDPIVRPFFENVLYFYPHYARVFFPFVALSSKLIDALYEERLKLKEQGNEKWIYCEAFVGSFIISHPKYHYLKLDEIADLTWFEWRNHKHIKDQRIYETPKIVHPVTSINFVRKNLMQNDIETLFSSNSTLFSGLQFEKAEEFLPILEHEIKKKKDPELLIKFWNYALEQRWISTLPAVNIAFAKPVTQSSICTFSLMQNLEQDASTVVNGIIDANTWCHTDFEENPWIMIDLLNFYEIRSILVYVRPDSFHRFRDFRIDLSIDKENWNTLYRKVNGDLPDSANLKPIIITAVRGQKAKFVKIIQENTDFLHLCQVEIYSY